MSWSAGVGVLLEWTSLLSGDTSLGSGSLLFALLFENHGNPPLLRCDVSANGLSEDLHPAFLLLAGVGIEINDLAVREAEPEAFLNEHIAFLIFSKARLATTATLCRGWLLKRALVVKELGRFREVDCRSRLAGTLMVGCELGAF
jgi:hypothetical protein